MEKWYQNKWLWIPLTALVMFILGFGSGRYALPPKTVVTEKIVTVEKQVVVTQTKTDVKLVYVKDKTSKKTDQSVTTIVKNPDGSVVTTINKNIKTDQETRSSTDLSSKTDSGSSSTKEVKIVDNKKTVTTAQSGWIVQAGVGINIPTMFLGEKQIGIPGLKGLVVEAGVSRKVIGPLYMGLFGNTQGTLGLTLSGSF